MRILPYLHPVWQVCALGLALWVLVLGLRMRGLRKRGAEARRAGLVGRHARAGSAFVAALAAGYTAGPITLGVARGEPVFESGHAFFATLTLLVLLLGGTLGLRLWRGRGPAGNRDLHAFCMGLGLFLAFVTGMLGLGLLP